MSRRNFYMLDLFTDMKPVVKQTFLLHCSNEIIKFFCNCLFNVVHGQIKMASNVSRKKLEKFTSLIDFLCAKNNKIVKKRQSLASKTGLKLLHLIERSILDHLMKRHDIGQ